MNTHLSSPVWTVTSSRQPGTRSTDHDGGYPGLDQLRAAFETEHPYCAAAEIWHDIDGEPALLRIECGTPTEHHAAPRRV